MQSILAPFHLLSFSALLGSQIYQTFIVTKVARSALPSSAYVDFQKTIFPVYFHSQSLLIILTVLSFPAPGALSLLQHKSDWVPFAVAAGVSTLNTLVYGPRTRQLTLERVEQSLADASKANLDPQDVDVLESSSPEMAAIKKRFSRAHAMCIHLNLLSFASLMWYTWRLSTRLRF